MAKLTKERLFDIAEDFGPIAHKFYMCLAILDKGEGLTVTDILEAAYLDSYNEFKPAAKALEDSGLIHSVRVPSVYGGYLTQWFINSDSTLLQERLSGSAWNKLREKVFERDEYTCAYCTETQGELECDHIVPISRGGTNELINLVTSCRACNNSKRDQLLDEWRGRNVDA